MLIKRTPREKTPLDLTIEGVFSELDGLNADSEEYDSMSDQLVKLMKLKKEIEPSWRVDPNTLATIGANLLGILCILHYEKVNVVASKALSFVGKLK